MKKKFTFMLTALMLLMCLTAPQRLWGQTYQKISDVSDITTSTYVIAAKVGNVYYALPKSISTSTIAGVEIDVDDGVISASDATNYIFTITKTNSGYSIYNGSKYVNCNVTSTSFGSSNTAVYHNIDTDDSYNGTFLIWYDRNSGTDRGIIYQKGSVNKFGAYAISNASGNNYCVLELFKYTPPTTPTITVDESLALTPFEINDAELSVSYANITPTSGTITLYDGDNNIITPDWFSAHFNADYSKVIYSASNNPSSSTRSLRMLLTVSDGTNNASADVAVTQDFILTTMDQIFARATANGSTAKEVTINFNDWVISGQNNGNSYSSASKAWLTDGTKGCAVYGNSSATYPQFQANDKLNGVITCNLQLFTSFAQITGVKKGMTGLSTTNDGVVTPVTNKTIAELSAINTGSVVTLTNLTYSSSNSMLTDEDNNTIKPYSHIYSSMSFVNGKTYNVTGVFETNSSNPTKRIYPRSAADIVEVTTPVITVVQSLSSFTYCEGDGPSDAQSFTVSGNNLEGNISLTLTDGEDSAFEISLSNNSGYSNTLTLEKSGTTVSETPIYVRMKENLPIIDGGYSDAISLTSTNATTATVNLTGIVTEPMVVWNLSTNSYNSASANEVTWTSSFATMSVTKNGGTNVNNYLGGVDNHTETRFYNKNIMTIAAASGYEISSVVIGGSTLVGLNNTWTNATYNSSTATITPTNGNNPFYVQISATVNITSITVYYSESTATNYAINIDDMAHGTVVADKDEATEGTTITLTVYPDAGYYLQDNNIMVDVTGVNLTKINAGQFTFEMPAEDVTVSADFSVYSGAYYQLVNNASELIPGRHYIIASSKDAGAAYAMGAQNSNYREQVGISIVGNFIYGETSGVHEVVLSGDNTNLYTLYDDGYGATSKGYLYATSGNVLKTRSDNTSNDNGKWTISISEGVATIVSQISGTDVSNTIKYNSGSSRFSCYTPSSGMSLVYLFMKANETSEELYGNTTVANLTIPDNSSVIVKTGVTLTVTGTLTNTNPDNLIIEDGGQLITSSQVKATFKKTTTASSESKAATNYWYAISSPIDDIAISTFATGTHNVYSYVEKSHYWNEYRGASDPTLGTAPFTNLENGRGYLYRSTASGIDFKGDVNIDDATYTLSYTPDAGNLAGFHLIGNPFSYNIYKGVDIPNTYLEANFYTLTPAGGWELGYDSGAAEPTEIKPNTGILVQAISTADGQDLIIAKTRNGGVAKYENDQISFKVENSDYYDVACVQFKDGRGLNKIDHRNAEIPMLYIMNNGENFASASMPDNTDVINLGFEAKTMGEYTISLKAEGQYSYMHLVDKLTGNDIDMLVEDSYTFMGTPNDRNDRFVLRLNYNAAGIDTESDIFAYQSGNDIMVSGEGELQVFDITGRKVMTTDINGVETINGMNRGVYIFRLNEKTQKIVVR